MPEANETAAESLARAERVQAAMAGRAGRYPTFLTIYGAGTIGMVVWSGFISVSLVSTIAFIVVWTGFVTAICLWVNGQRANLRGMGSRHVLYLAVQFALFSAVLTVGFRFEQRLAYWLPAGLLVSLPIFVGAAYEARHLREARRAA